MTARISRRTAIVAPLAVAVAAPAAGSGAFAAALAAVRPYESGAATARMCDAAIMEWNACQDVALLALASAQASNPVEAAEKLRVVFTVMTDADTWADLTTAEGELLRSVQRDLVKMG